MPLRPQARSSLRRAGDRFQLTFEEADPLSELLVLVRQLVTSFGEVAIVPPPVEADLLRLVDGTHHQPYANRQQLDFGDRDLDVAGDDQAFVEHPIENADKAARAAVADLDGIVRHKWASLKVAREYSPARVLRPSPRRTYGSNKGTPETAVSAAAST